MKTRTRFRRSSRRTVGLLALLLMAGQGVAQNPFQGFPAPSPPEEVPAPPDMPNTNPLPIPDMLPQSVPVPPPRIGTYEPSIEITLPNLPEQHMLARPADNALRAPRPDAARSPAEAAGIQLVGLTRAAVPIAAVEVDGSLHVIRMGESVPGQDLLFKSVRLNDVIFEVDGEEVSLRAPSAEQGDS